MGRRTQKQMGKYNRIVEREREMSQKRCQTFLKFDKDRRDPLTLGNEKKNRASSL